MSCLPLLKDLCFILNILTVQGFIVHPYLAICQLTVTVCIDPLVSIDSDELEEEEEELEEEDMEESSTGNLHDSFSASMVTSCLIS